MATLSNAIRVRYEAIRSLAFGGISPVYAAVGTPTLNPVRILKITNTTDADVYVSIDGVVDHDIVPKSSSIVFDYGSDKSYQGGLFEVAQNTTFYVKEVAGAATLGAVYITCIYASIN